MSYLTRAEFATIAQSKAGYKGLKGFVTESRQFSRSGRITSVFLSHAHTDKDVVEQAVTFFRTLGIDLYVDWLDETMPDRPSGQTATNIRNKIRENDKFVLLATNTAVASKWCNWEVGIGDILKHPNKKLSLLPLADNNSDWRGNEYLQVYPRIEKSVNYPSEYMVWYPDGSVENLVVWLRR